MFICSQNLTHGDDPLGLMETQAAQLAMRETEIFVDLQVFRGLREEITQSGDERVELMALQALRRDLMVSACDEAMGMMHQVVEVKEKADVNIAILGREKAVAEEEARGLDEKVKELGLETEFRTKQQDVRNRFETKKREMLADIKRKMGL
ncbi:hypothetical protein LTR24_006794 [Lithohypha guttulata]|uniref:Uncharacterized protein n=1 Tax=Lithohypha guttulata TaxID=1690604 RepID=A0ABR0K4Z0_9EURO|nr:hypothetical protein LTR24_006794 [Lithohypha guttulata]